MRRILAGSIAIASLLAASSALAADMAPRPYTKAPVIVDPGYNWTGFYAGLNGGYSWGKANTLISAPSPFPPGFPVAAFAPFRANVNGGIAGGQLGYNWQVDPKWVVGLEGDIQWSGERASATLTAVGPRYGSSTAGIPGGTDANSIITQIANLSYDLQWFATFRGRAGWLADPQTLLYGTGGLAVGGFRYSAQTTVGLQVFGPGLGGTTPGAGFSIALPGVSQTDTRVGWTLGAGIERKFSRNWSAKLEYLYLDFGSKSFLSEPRIRPTSAFAIISFVSASTTSGTRPRSAPSSECDHLRIEKPRISGAFFIAGA